MIYGSLTWHEDKYHTRKALNSPPHITLVPPFWYPTLKKSALLSTVSQLNRDFNSSFSDE
ncbi:unnamed protein product, partial [marine sediment metagenome]